ncbi:glycosyltransferase [uncultured Pontibacter sp.]|uniref:glycosyltransferase n=1 Tax=uncultured Pontibacter sp. TaxID=453356 RepID=UPI0026385978|nr:glycosyltransferase [uncultured Pontibacter sp.]
MSEDDTMHVVYVGYPGFPLGLAQVERQKLIAKGLISRGCQVTVLNRYGIHEKGEAADVLEQPSFEGIPFVYTSGSPYRENAFIKRNLFKIKGLVNEVRYLISSRKNNKLDAILVTTNTFYDVLFYCLVAKLCKVPAILDNVEYWTAHPIRKSIFKRLDNYLYDQYAFKVATKVICISSFLVDVVKRNDPLKPVIKIPAIVDFSKFGHAREATEPYFLFCGSAAYLETINFILDAYNQLEQTRYKLYLVTSGTDADEERVKASIEHSKYKDGIRFFSRLSYDQLLKLYTNSSALLIPLRDTKQDRARFPHKIGEYCAAKQVIISTGYGEINHYFTDKQNALIANTYSVPEYAEKMHEVIENPGLATVLGQRSYQTGQSHFSHEISGKKIIEFIAPSFAEAKYNYGELLCDT